VSQQKQVLLDHFVADQDSQLAHEVKLSLNYAFLFFRLVSTAHKLIAIFVIPTPFALAKSRPLGFDCQDFTFAKVLQHLDHDVVKRNDVFEKVKGVF